MTQPTSRDLVAAGAPDSPASGDAILGSDLRTAFYRAIGSPPGVERVPGEVAIEGREGVAVALTLDGLRNEIIFDPGSGRALGTRTVLVDCSPRYQQWDVRNHCENANPVAVGTVIDQTTTVQLVVDKLGRTS
jgi:hypothetical protein